jgi:hypothetical protein
MSESTSTKVVRATKVAKATTAKVVAGSSDAAAIAVPAVSQKKAAVRRPRFNPCKPVDFMNLCNVWAYRNSQKRSLRKMQKKSAGVLDDEARVKVQENISRNERNLQQLDDNLREALGRVSLLCDLSKAGVSLDASSANAMSDVANALASSFKEPADKTEKAE